MSKSRKQKQAMSKCKKQIGDKILSNSPSPESSDEICVCSKSTLCHDITGN